MNDYIVISNTSLIISVSLMLIVAIIALVNKLGITKSVLLGTVRSFAQLTIMGYVLEWIFDLQKWYFTVLMISIMITFATYDSYKRIDFRPSKTFFCCLSSMVVGTALPLAFMFYIVLQITPWYNPQYVIPISAMVISNTMTAISICLNTFGSELRLRRHEVEAKLSLGAKKGQSLEVIRKSAIKAGLIPTINALMVLGIVKLPGMMTGQILGGVAPIESVKYQLLIMYMISSAAAISLFLLVFLVEKGVFNNREQLRYELIK
ncbi:MAG: iron export ABC transporter permease subunit FetB [Candidatus Cloacimonetes bacterium]|nr:iron export ABC transporter permease subunit FetB [Candidatus Cloacimonadota bacterium]